MKIPFAVIRVSVSALTAAQVTCTTGYYDAGAAGCRKCPLGTYQAEKWQTECKPCPDGYVSIVEGSTKCTPYDKPNEEPTEFKDSFTCIPGSAPDRNGACYLCKPGHYMATRPNGKGQICRLCDYEEIQPKAGQTKCIPCDPYPSETYASNNRTACVKCPKGKTILFATKRGNDRKCGTCGPGRYAFLTTSASGANATLTCEDREAGTFKPKAGIEDCFPCPRNHY